MWKSSPPRVMSGRAPTREDRAMPCILKLILELPNTLMDIVLGPEEQIAYVTVTVR